MYLAPGESKTVILTVAPKAMEAVDDEGKRRIESGRFTLYVGTSQPDNRSVELTGRVPVKLDLKLV